jgi:hypothetical protein
MLGGVEHVTETLVTDLIHEDARSHTRSKIIGDKIFTDRQTTGIVESSGLYRSAITQALSRYSGSRMGEDPRRTAGFAPAL